MTELLLAKKLLEPDSKPIQANCVFCGHALHDKLANDPTLQPPPAGQENFIVSITGIRVECDPTLPPNVGEFRDRRGKLIERFYVK